MRDQLPRCQVSVVTSHPVIHFLSLFGKCLAPCQTTALSLPACSTMSSPPSPPSLAHSTQREQLAPSPREYDAAGNPLIATSMLAAPPADDEDTLPTQILTTDALRDPPPPYPHHASPNSRRRRARRTLNTSNLSEAPHADMHPFPASPTAGEDQLPSPRLLGPPGQGIGGPNPRETFRRRRTMSGSETVRSGMSATSAAPSLARTVASLFADDWSGDEEDDCPAVSPRPDGAGTRGQVQDASHSPQLGDESEPEVGEDVDGRDKRGSFSRRWRRYWRPLGRRAYWAALFHLLALNFPWALVAWVYLFVFTLVSTLMYTSVRIILTNSENRQERRC
jgi:hypothetical protein